MIIYISTIIGSLNILYGFIERNYFFIGIGFAWNFLTLTLGVEYEPYFNYLSDRLKRWVNENYICYKRRR